MKFPKLTVVEWLLVVCIIILAASILKPILFPERDIFPISSCANNLKALGRGIIIYSKDFGEYPSPDKWCDLLIEKELIEENETGRRFKCYSNQKVKCSYSINPYCEPNSPNDIVLLFESKGGWNQYGGPELLNFDNHKGKGCNILFNDYSVRFVTPEEVAELNWGEESSDEISSEVQAIVDKLNDWDKEELDVVECPNLYPNRVSSGETKGWIITHKQELEKLGFTVKWNHDKKIYELQKN
jgi:hypothetical protein